MVTSISGRGSAHFLEPCRSKPRILGYRCEQVLQYLRNMGSTVPSYEEIADEFGISTRAKVCEIIARLERYGYVERIPQDQRQHRYARSIRLKNGNA